MSGVCFFIRTGFRLHYVHILTVKKITFSILLGLATVSLAHSQNLEIIKPGGNHVLNDSTIVAHGIAGINEFNQVLYVINSSGVPLTVNLQRQIVDTVTGSQNAICWDGICYGPSVNISSFPENIAPGDTEKAGNEFNGDYLPNGNAGTTTIHYIFFDVNNPTYTAAITVKYDATPTGISSITDGRINFSAPYPNPANSTVSFSYSLSNGVQSANLKLFNLLGDCVQTLSLNGLKNKATMDVQSIPAGIYVCEIEAEGCQPVYQKLIIQK